MLLCVEFRVSFSLLLGMSDWCLVSLSNVPVLIDLSFVHNPGIETDNVWVPQSKHNLNLLDRVLVGSVSEQLQSGVLALVEAFIDLAKAVVLWCLGCHRVVRRDSCLFFFPILYLRRQETRNKAKTYEPPAMYSPRITSLTSAWT